MTLAAGHIRMDTTPSSDSTSSHANADASFRPMHCELNALTRADGSALFTQGTIEETTISIVK